MSFLTSLPPPSSFCGKTGVQPGWHYLAISFPGQKITQWSLSPYLSTDRFPAYLSPLLHLSLAPHLASSEKGGCAYADSRWYLWACMSCSFRRMSGCHLCPELSFLACSWAWTVTEMWVFSYDSNYDLQLVSGFRSLSSYYIMQHVWL